MNSEGTEAAVIDMATPLAARNIGGAPASIRFMPVLVDGATVSIALPGPLPPGQTYSVLIDTGVLIDLGGAPFDGTNDSTTWQFSIRVPRPVAVNPPFISVSADGDGDYCTIQGAIDSVAENNTQRVIIDIAKGRYEEILFVKSTKPQITLRGADRFDTVIAYPNNNNLNPTVATRPMASVEASNFTLENLTLWNTTPKGGSQAEALRLSGQRGLVSRVNLKSFQDTLLVTGSAMIRDSYIEGDVDFIWGDGSAYFLRTEIRSLTSGGYITQIRNPQGRAGFVFVECYLTAAPGVTNTWLSRIAPDTFPYSQVAFLWSLLDSHIAPQGWQFNNNALEATAANYPNIRFWEHRVVDAAGKSIDRAGRHPLSREISEEEAGQLANPAFVLNGWEPPAASAAAIFLSGLRQTYTGSPLRPTVTTDPPGLQVELLFNGAPSAPVNAGSYAVTARIVEPGYAADAVATFQIDAAPVTISLENLNQRADGAPRAATVRTTPAGVALDVTYEGSAVAPTAEGNYLVEAHVRDANYTGAASGVLTLTPNRPVAFPGAEGFGAYSLGGRGGDVYHVTTLADSGNGSLRQGIQSATGPRTIVFDVSGTIDLRSRLSINKSNLTIAGQTAPGDGITVRGFGTLVSRVSHVVIRYLRFRLGDTNCPNVQDDALSVDQASDVVLDHVSASWSIDETLSVTDSNRVSVQWSTIAESLSRSCHAEGAHGYGTLLRAFDGKLSTVSFHHNLFAHHSNRSPRVGDTVNLDFVNNVVYNWGGDAGYSGGAEEGTTRLNYIGNALIAGASTAAGARARAFRGGSINTHIYAARNWIDSNVNGQRDGGDTGQAMIQGAFTPIGTRFDFPAITTAAPTLAMEQVLTDAGASRPRDAVDTRLANAVRNGQGAIIDSQTQAGGWPTLATRPSLPDTDGDGIPDAIEAAAGLSPNDKSDGAKVAANGYTNLENYLNSLVTP
ncbi:MAG: hypothetical protein IT162_22205 [Bryobacterales bacterium]|nr:hypothetical protein [Bryobacterales bacterium]